VWDTVRVDVTHVVNYLGHPFATLEYIDTMKGLGVTFDPV